jgi:hypothetical protein
MKYTVEFSKEVSKEWGTSFLSKLVLPVVDNILGVGNKTTYYVWGSKQLTGEIELDITEWVVQEKPFETKDGKTIPLKYITGRR